MAYNCTAVGRRQYPPLSLNAVLSGCRPQGYFLVKGGLEIGPRLGGVGLGLTDSFIPAVDLIGFWVIYRNNNN